MAKTFTIRLAGKDIVPDNLPIRELAQILQAVHSMLHVAEADTDSVDDDPATQLDLVVSLVGIEATGSTSLAFASNDDLEAEDRMRSGIQLMRQRETSPQGQRIHKQFRDQAKRMGTVIQFLPRDSKEPIAEVYPDEEIDQPSVIVGETTLYGKLLRVGGVQPKALISLDSGVRMSIPVSIPLAQKLAPRLYEEIGLQGTAQWDSATWTITHFLPNEVIDYRPGGLVEAFGELSEAAGPEAWKNAVDVCAAIDLLRRSDDCQ